MLQEKKERLVQKDATTENNNYSFLKVNSIKTPFHFETGFLSFYIFFTQPFKEINTIEYNLKKDYHEKFKNTSIFIYCFGLYFL